MSSSELLWTCKTCHIAAPAEDKVTHLSSEFHARNLFVTWFSMSDVWTCTICDITISADDREAHEAGKQHKKNQTWTCIVCDTTVPAHLRESHQASKKHRKNQTWTCTVCNITIPVDRQEKHQSKKEHREKLKSAQKPMTAKTLKKSDQELERERRVKIRQFRMGVGLCNCPTCKTVMYGEAQESYQKGNTKGDRFTIAKYVNAVVKSRKKDRTAADLGAVYEELQKPYEAQIRAQKKERDCHIDHRRRRKSLRGTLDELDSE